MLVLISFFVKLTNVLYSLKNHSIGTIENTNNPAML